MVCKRSHLIVSILFLVNSLFLSTATAQPGKTGGKIIRFEKHSPAIGQLLPDLTVYDESGKDFHVRSIKGSYSVIVFGCLT